MLQNSDIDWTLARCGKMEDTVSNQPLKASSDTLQGFAISTSHIASFFVRPT
ncbi:hypothetical protein QW180_22620 [Vibrio sinaloensis]|nr:hypothetical protein [Vibrio sinaloensis]